MPAPLQRLLAVATLAVLAGCGGGDAAGAGADGGDSLAPPAGVDLAAGTSVREWSLLSVPRDGGSARARSVRDPSRVVWSGEAELPPADEVHLLDGPLVILRASDGTVHRYDPRADEVESVGQVGDGARWVGGGRRGVWIDGEGSGLLEIGPDGAWRYELAGRPAWAAPAGDGSMAVLVERSGGGGELWLVRRGDAEPQSRADRPYALPALVTAWGKRLAARDPGGETLQLVALPSLTATTAVGVPGTITAMAASPSSHEVYVGVDAPPRLVRVSRFAEDARVMATVDGQLREIRPATLGGFLLAHGAGAPVWVPLDGGEVRRLEGEWRADLPLGTPDGRVLLAGAEGLRVWDPEGGSEPVAAPDGLWWGAVHWNPAPPAVVSDRVGREEGGVPRPGPADTGEGGPPPVDGDVAAADTAPTDAAGRPGAVDSASVDTAAADTPARRAGDVPPGHYAVVTAAQERAGVRRLLESLSGAGYPTALQRHRDDAGQLWYRGMVGAYPGREEAEAAARQLRAERDLSVWITEVRAGTDAEEIFR